MNSESSRSDPRAAQTILAPPEGRIISDENENELRARVGLVIPALDEEEALPLVLAELPPGVVDRIVVVDNGSTDRTADVARAGGAFVVHEQRKGYGQACLSGLAVLLGDEPSELDPLSDEGVVLFLDADHSDFPEDAPDVVGPILAGEADMVIGSRLLGGATKRALLPQAWYGNKLACFLMRFLFGARHTDLGPFRAIRVDALKHLEMGDVDFGWTVEMQLKARIARMRVVEVPVRYRERIGSSKITGTLSGTLRAAWKILGWILGWRVALLFTRRRIPRFRSGARSGS